MADVLGDPETCAPPVALAQTPVARPLTRSELVRMRGALADFETALSAWDRRRQESRRKVGDPGRKDDAAPGDGPDGKPDGRRHHTLIVAGYLGDGYGPDKVSTEEAVVDACQRYFDLRPPGGDDSAHDVDGYPEEARVDRIHLVLDSSGGSLDSAYKTVVYLRAFAKEVRVYVPSRAKSAATLIAIGADRVEMSPFAELGPLDTQIVDPRNPTARISALDCYRSVDHVREFGILTIPRALAAILDETRTRISLEQLIEAATTLAIGSVRPMLEHISALDFGAWGRTLKIGETYAKMLRLRLHTPDSEAAAKRLAWQLVYGYPHHPYPIDRAEAMNLGISVETMPRDVYRAAQEISAACRGEARFVGFANDVDAAINVLVESDDGAPRLPVGVTASGALNGSAQASAVSENFK